MCVFGFEWDGLGKQLDCRSNAMPRRLMNVQLYPLRTPSPCRKVSRRAFPSCRGVFLRFFTFTCFIVVAGPFRGVGK